MEFLSLTPSMDRYGQKEKSTTLSTSDKKISVTKAHSPFFFWRTHSGCFSRCLYSFKIVVKEKEARTFFLCLERIWLPCAAETAVMISEQTIRGKTNICGRRNKRSHLTKRQKIFMSSFDQRAENEATSFFYFANDMCFQCSM